jgi:hypothetical protein
MLMRCKQAHLHMADMYDYQSSREKTWAIAVQTMCSALQLHVLMWCKQAHLCVLWAEDCIKVILAWPLLVTPEVRHCQLVGHAHSRRLQGSKPTARAQHA